MHESGTYVKFTRLARICSRKTSRQLSQRGILGFRPQFIPIPQPLPRCVDRVLNPLHVATFANEDMRLVPGQLVDVAVALDTLPNAIVVPREAVNVGPDGRYVYVVDKDDNAQLRPVTVLFDGGATIAVSGKVNKGDRVITDGQLRVVPGKPVSIAKAAAPKAP